MSPSITNNLKQIDTQFHEQSLFFDASDSFDSIINVNTSTQSNKTPESPSSSSSADVNHLQPVDSDHKIPNKLKNSDKLKRKLRSSRVHNSSVASVDEDDRINPTDSSVSGSSFLFLLAGLVIKMMGFQLNLFFGSVTLPMWLIYYSYMFMIDPFRSINLVKHYILRKVSRILGLCSGFVKWVMQIWIRKHESTLRLCVRIGWGLLWSVYVGFVLCSLLVFAFVVSGVMLKCMIEEPVQITRQLSFDYTKDSPTAFLPVMSCPKSSFLESGEVIWYGCGAGSRVIPLDHKVRGTVSLTLPESDYNRNLGIFQVRVDFLNGDGKCLFSTRQPCMLRYKSQPIRLLLTFLKLAPLITGYSSEAQTLNMKFSGYTEGTVPTSCLRVILEQRAEFTRGAGVPVIYAASLKLESEPPFLKRILWSWKWTIYIWVAVMIFVVELLFTVVCCCTPVIVPRLQPRRL
ncbi:putative Seipin family protein [Helianthus debilis subsp. tardiflorus]